jgi:thioesterase domain-containing protein
VKIRGFRIELEEIERSLCAHPSVLEGAVIAHPDRNGDQNLVVYVVPKGAHALTVDALRAYLRNTLPDQMVPSTFHFLPALPRTANGKVSRSALSAQQESSQSVPSDNRPPADFVEACLIRLWEELLEPRPINVTANFFELGGHSLLAARLSTSIERAFGTKLPLSVFIDATTIEQQARLIRAHRKNAPWPLLVPIRANGSKPPLFCMHLREGDVWSYRDLARHLPPEQPLYGLQSSGLDGAGKINTRIEDMARDYAAEIRKLRPGGPYAICGWSFGGVVAFEVARELERQGQRVALLALFDSFVPGHGRRRPAALLEREIRRAPLHVGALLHGTNRLSYLRRKLHTAVRLVEGSLWRMLLRWHRRGGWLPHVLRSVEQGNKVALCDYVPDVYGGRITLFKVARPRSIDPCVGWENLTAGGLDTHELRGTHLDIVVEPNVKTLAERLSRVLDETWADMEYDIRDAR